MHGPIIPLTRGTLKMSAYADRIADLSGGHTWPGRCRKNALSSGLKRGGDELGEVLDLHRPFQPLGLDAILEHGDAERAARGDRTRAGGAGLVQAHPADALAVRFLHERAAAAAAAAEAAPPAAFHLHQRAAHHGQALQPAARLVVDVVVAAHV